MTDNSEIGNISLSGDQFMFVKSSKREYEFYVANGNKGIIIIDCSLPDQINIESTFDNIDDAMMVRLSTDESFLIVFGIN